MISPYLPELASAGGCLVEHQPFWQHCDRSELRFQQCDACDRVQHPPAPRCAQCGAKELRWSLAGDDAELFSFTVVHHASHPGLAGVMPYNVAIVAFPSLQWVRLVSNVVDVAPHALRIGMPLALIWAKVRSGHQLPLFREAAR